MAAAFLPALHHALHHVLFGAQVAFYAVFGLFVVAFVALVVITLRWAVQRDRAGRAEWRSRRASTNGRATVHPRSNGQAPGHPRRPGADPPKKA